MRYSSELIFRRIRNGMKSYCIIIFQLFISFTVLCTAFNMDFSMNERLRSLQSEIRGSQIRADIMSESVVNGCFGYETYADIEIDPRCDTGIVTTAVIMAINGGAPDSIIVICSPDRYYCDLFSENMTEGSVYCTRKLYDEILDGKVRLSAAETDVALSGDGCAVNGKTYRLAVINNKTGITEIIRDETSGNSYDLDKVMFFPQEAGDDWEHESFVSFQVWFYPDSSEYYTDAYKKLYKDLRGVSFSIYDPAAFLIKECQDIKDALNIMTLISAMLLVITLVGTTGVLMILIYKRRKDTAAAVAVGASIMTIRTELYTEILIVCSVGILSGAVGAAAVTQIAKTHISFFETKYTVQTIAAVILSCISIPAAVSAASLYGYGGININALLSGDE